MHGPMPVHSARWSSRSNPDRGLGLQPADDSAAAGVVMVLSESGASVSSSTRSASHDDVLAAFRAERACKASPALPLNSTNWAESARFASKKLEQLKRP